MEEERNKYKITLSDFLKYNDKRMSDKERNRFEKELQKDPFTEDAAEGLAGLDHEKVQADLKLLNKRLKSRTNKNQKLIYYRFAASVAVLMIISSVFLVLDRNKLSNETGVVFEIPTAQSIKREPPPVVDDRIKFQDGDGSKKSQIPQGKTESRVSSEKTESVEAEIYFKKSEPSESVAKITSDDFSAAAVPEAGGINERRSSFAARSRQLNEGRIRDYLPPLPVIGHDSFNIYIEDNIRYPEEHINGNSEVVILDFKVLSTGIIDSIKVISSPGRPFSDEAVRILKQGPGWKPARMEGKEIEDKVTLRIIFR